MNVAFRLCKKVSDPPGETKGAWTSVQCCVCHTALRGTHKMSKLVKKYEVTVHPICFDCAKQGPEYVLLQLGSCGKVSRGRKG